MSLGMSRRTLLQATGLLFTASAVSAGPLAALADETAAQHTRLNLNENAWGPSPSVVSAIEREFSRLARYADDTAAQQFIEQIAAHERISADQVVPGEILGALGFYLGSQGGPGGEFLYSIPGYLALIDAARHVGGVGVGVPLNAAFENDLPALQARINVRTRALYLINPHNPTGTVSDGDAFLHFLRSASQRALAIVDEAYLEYAEGFPQRSAVSLVRDGANVLVFRTFDKIHGLAGLPIGYALVPRELAAALRKQGLGDAESLGRLNLAAASAALADTKHVTRISHAVAIERARWTAVLDELQLEHTHSQANFVYFNSRRPHAEIAAALHVHGIEVGRKFLPYENWVRITIGLPEENLRAQAVLRALVRGAA